MTESRYSDSRVREWARNNGYSPGERGRLPMSVHEAFKMAYPEHILPGSDENPNGTCIACSNPKNSHRMWCDFYQPPAPVPVPVVVEDFPTEAPLPAETPVQPPGDADATFARLVREIAATAVTDSAPAIDEELVRKIARDEAETAALSMSRPVVHVIHIADRPIVKLDKVVHHDFEACLKIIGRGLNLYLVGPPGTGKSTIAKQAAEALGLDYGEISCSPTMPESKLFGFIDANGIFRDPLFCKIWDNGGVFSWEEIDNSHPGIIAAMNTALANGRCAFPDGMHVKHPNCRFVATANTNGMGATRQFNGRQKLDAATMNRFAKRFIGVDETMEETVTRAEMQDQDLAGEWLGIIRRHRATAARLNLEVVISPRDAIIGAGLLDIGFTVEEALQMTIWEGTSADVKAAIVGGK